jgi:hypothetical protein
MVDVYRGVIELLEVDVVAPVYFRSLSLEDLDQPLVVYVVPEAKVGRKLSPDGFR